MAGRLLSLWASPTTMRWINCCSPTPGNSTRFSRQLTNACPLVVVLVTTNSGNRWTRPPRLPRFPAQPEKSPRPLSMYGMYVTVVLLDEALNECFLLFSPRPKIFNFKEIFWENYIFNLSTKIGSLKWIIRNFKRVIITLIENIIKTQSLIFSFLLKANLFE